MCHPTCLSRPALQPNDLHMLLLGHGQGAVPDPSEAIMCEPLQDPNVLVLDMSRDLPYDYITLLENILDPRSVSRRWGPHDGCPRPTMGKGLDTDHQLGHGLLLLHLSVPSHVPYTHHKTVGNRAWAGAVPLTLVGPLTSRGFNGTWERMVPMGPMTRRDPSQVSARPIRHTGRLACPASQSLGV